MKLEVTQENLARALNTVSRVAQTKTSLPILNNILFRADDNRLTLSATNLEVAITETIGAKISRSGVITIPARLVSDYVQNLPKGIIRLELDGTKLLISCDHYKSTMNGVAADEYPALPETGNARSITLPASILKRSIQQTILTVSHDETRPILTGLYLHSSDGQLYIAGTDGYRLSERRVVAADDEISAIIPATTMQDIVRVLPDDCDEVVMNINEQQVTFAMNDITITSRLIEGKYPDYRQLIPASNETSFECLVSELVRICKIASLFARESGGSITLKADATASTVSIHSLASQLGENISELNVKPTSDGTITLNSRYMIEALGVVDAASTSIGFSGKLAPCVIRPLKDDSYTHIIMPLKS